MSGTCAEIIDDTDVYLCSVCEEQQIRPHFEYCPMCGEHIVVVWNAMTDCKVFPEDD